MITGNIKSQSLVLISCFLQFLSQAQVKVQSGKEPLKECDKTGSVILLDKNKKPIGSVEYYSFVPDSLNIICSEKTYDMERNVAFFYQYYINLDCIQLDTMYGEVIESTLGSYLTSPYYYVNVNAREDTVFLYQSVEQGGTDQKPNYERTTNYSFVFSIEKAAKEMASWLNDFCRKRLRAQ